MNPTSVLSVSTVCFPCSPFCAFCVLCSVPSVVQLFIRVIRGNDHFFFLDLFRAFRGYF